MDAINENTEQLELETNAYIRAVEEEEDKQRRLHNALSINAGIQNNQVYTGDLSHDELIQSTIQSFEHEIMNIKQLCQDHEAEMINLNQILLEQAQASETLSIQQDELVLKYNSIERESKVFEDIHRQLTQQCHDAETERSQLHRVRLHSALFDIVVDGRGELYPLINNLRLSHRPKGDLAWAEINTAWSQAIQLLMFMSSTVKFSTRNYEIIPLMHCAKIIEVDCTGKKVYHHFGVDFESIDKKTHSTNHIIVSLKVFYSLLYQLFAFLVTSKRDFDTSMIPNEMTANTIGSYNLRILNENDDKDWRSAINCIASNLRWLSNVL